MDLLLPDLSLKVAEKQEKQKLAHDSKSRERALAVGDQVYTRVYGRGQPRWMPAEVTHCTGPVSFKVSLEDGTVHRRHQDQLRQRLDTPTTGAPDFTNNELQTSMHQPQTLVTLDSSSSTSPEPATPTPPSSTPTPTPAPAPAPAPAPSIPTPTPRYPTRDRRPPERLTYTSF